MMTTPYCFSSSIVLAAQFTSVQFNARAACCTETGLHINMTFKKAPAIKPCSRRNARCWRMQAIPQQRSEPCFKIGTVSKLGYSNKLDDQALCRQDDDIREVHQQLTSIRKVLPQPEVPYSRILDH